MYTMRLIGIDGDLLSLINANKINTNSFNILIEWSFGLLCRLFALQMHSQAYISFLFKIL